MKEDGGLGTIGETAVAVQWVSRARGADGRGWGDEQKSHVENTRGGQVPQAC